MHPDHLIHLTRARHAADRAAAAEHGRARVGSRHTPGGAWSSVTPALRGGAARLRAALVGRSPDAQIVPAACATC